MAIAGLKRLSAVESAKLIHLLEVEYKKLNMTDEQFATHAAQVLGFAVNRAHVTLRRSELKIPSIRDEKRAEVRKAKELAKAQAKREREKMMGQHSAPKAGNGTDATEIFVAAATTTLDQRVRNIEDRLSILLDKMDKLAAVWNVK